MTAVPSPALARDGRMQVDYDKTPTRFQSTIECYDEKSSPFRIPERSQNEGIDIFSTGWEDEDDDYVDMAPIKPTSAKASPRKHESPDLKVISKHLEHLHPKNHSGNSSPDDTHLPSVVIQPASPHDSLRSFGSTPKRSPTRSSLEDSDTSDYSSDDDSSESSSISDDSKDTADNGFDSRFGEDKNFEKSDPNHEQNNNSSDIKSPSQNTSQNQSPNTQRSNSASSDLYATKKSTTAGIAARKYLQMQSAMKPGSREVPGSSTGLQRSSSRVGAVQSRIKKNRLPSSTLASPTINSPTPDIGEKVGPFRQYRNTSDGNRCMSISESKRKSRTLDRDLSGSSLLQTEIIADDSEDDLPGSVKEDIFSGIGNRRSRDGAAVMKMISQRTKSSSLDSKYFEFLNGIALHQQVPQPLSAPCSPVVETRDRINSVSNISKTQSPDTKSSTCIKNKKAKRKKKKVPADDEEEAFQKYAETMSRFTSERGSIVDMTSASMPRVKNGSIERSLADFASDHFQLKAKEDKILRKKNSGGGGLARKFHFGKSKTLGRTGTKSIQTFAESVEAFNDQYTQQKTVTQEDNVQKSKKSDSLKKEKRRSFKIRRQGLSIKVRSKGRINSDSSLFSDSGSQPQTPCDDEEFTYSSRSGSQKSKVTPAIKQSLGFSVGDNRSLRSRTDSHSSRPGSPMVINTKEARSMTLDNRQHDTLKNARNNAASLKRGSSYGNLVSENSASRTSLNSEFSDGNSEMIGAHDEDLDDHKYKGVTMTGTLSRLLGRKLKDRKMDELDPSRFHELFSSGSLGRKANKKGKYATMGSPRMQNSLSREMLVEFSRNKINGSEDFFNENDFSRGYRINFCDDCDDEGVSPTAEFEMALRMEFGSRATPNKYATITGIRSARNSPSISRRSVLDTFSEDGDDEQQDEPVLGHRRQKSAGSADIVLNRSMSTKGMTLTAPPVSRLLKGKG